MILALKKTESDSDSCYYIALVQPIMYISCTACDLTKPRCPIWNFGQNLNSIRLHCYITFVGLTMLDCLAGMLDDVCLTFFVRRMF